MPVQSDLSWKTTNFRQKSRNSSVFREEFSFWAKSDATSLYFDHLYDLFHDAFHFVAIKPQNLIDDFDLYFNNAQANARYQITRALKEYSGSYFFSS